jgi:hypothetical protein
MGNRDRWDEVIDDPGPEDEPGPADDHAVRCRQRWLGEDAAGHPVPCPTCRPWVAEHRARLARLLARPPSGQAHPRPRRPPTPRPIPTPEETPGDPTTPLALLLPRVPRGRALAATPTRREMLDLPPCRRHAPRTTTAEERRHERGSHALALDDVSPTTGRDQQAAARRDAPARQPCVHCRQPIDYDARHQTIRPRSSCRCPQDVLKRADLAEVEANLWPCVTAPVQPPAEATGRRRRTSVRHRGSGDPPDRRGEGVSRDPPRRRPPPVRRRSR